MPQDVKTTQVIKKKVMYQELETVAKKMHEGGYRLACLMPEIVNTYNHGEDGEYTLPTTVCCVFERGESQE